MIEWTNGWKVINFELNGDQHHGFIKVTKLKYIVIECNKDVDCRPLDKITLNGHDNLIVQKLVTYESRAEIHCIEDNNGELEKSITTKKKLKKALGDENDDSEQIQG
tara:strand:- start:101 stop:421 length:321 start_codon:yes stop_codon:yes gene_type:complete